MQIKWTRAVGGLVLAAAIAGACTGAGSTTSPSSAAATSAPSASMAPESMAPSESMGSEPMAPSESLGSGMTGEQFGDACAAVPADGEGSFKGMSDDPVATAASNNPVLSTLVAAVTAAELGDTLNSAEDITVFAPTNDAFEAMDPETLQSAMDDPSGLLTTVLTYHVVAGQLSPEDLAGEHETLQGGTLTVEGEGEEFTVNGDANVVCGNVQTANATVYIIDAVLLPPSN
jgi:uncharacterized surface protein with fasciclin (FAS1) repeats